jgi:hypothetical protein
VERVALGPGQRWEDGAGQGSWAGDWHDGGGLEASRWRSGDARAWASVGGAPTRAGPSRRQRGPCGAGWVAQGRGGRRSDAGRGGGGVQGGGSVKGGGGVSKFLRSE